MSMKPFWETKIGETVTHRIYEKRYGINDPGYTLYKLLVTQVVDNKVQFSIKSYRVTPSGYKDGHSDKQHGSIWQEMTDSLESTLALACSKLF